MCVDVLPACMSVYHVLPGCPLRPEEGDRAPGTGLRAIVSSCVGVGK